MNENNLGNENQCMSDDKSFMSFSVYIMIYKDDRTNIYKFYKKYLKKRNIKVILKQ